MSKANAKQVAGRFEQDQETLHLWFPAPVVLRDVDSVTAFFDEVVADWIDPARGLFYLLVNYENLHIATPMADCYAANIERFQSRLLGTFRYGIPADFTGIAVSLGHLKLEAPANLFPDEVSARAAIDEARAQRKMMASRDTFSRHGRG
jgi:hypothetical protein